MEMGERNGELIPREDKELEFKAHGGIGIEPVDESLPDEDDFMNNWAKFHAPVSMAIGGARVKGQKEWKRLDRAWQRHNHFGSPWLGSDLKTTLAFKRLVTG
jgi:hypothetical protein